MKEIRGGPCKSGPSSVLRKDVQGGSRAHGALSTGQSGTTGWWPVGARSLPPGV